MKKIIFFTLLLSAFVSNAQTALDKIKAYTTENRIKLNLKSLDINDLVIVSEFSSESTGINNYHVKQRYAGIEVYNSDSNFWIKNNTVINGGQDFIPDLSQKINTSTPTLNVIYGLLSALTQLQESPFSTEIIESEGFKYKLKNGVLLDDPIRAQLVYFLINPTTLRLSWDFEFYSQNTKHLWSLKVDALTGAIIDQQDLVISCNFGHKHDYECSNTDTENLFTKTFIKESAKSIVLNPGTTQYRVIPFNFESPNHSPRQLITDPEFVSNASPRGWHDANSLTGTTASLRYNITRGNNVWARNDFLGTNSIVAPNGTSPTGFGSFPSLTFDFPYEGTNVDASTYIDAANTNLFYMNNIMHDLWYQYGFNELNRNFQVNNYGRGGAQNDAVIADSQDGSQAADRNLNNANFATPGDGAAPRMQMYLWDVGPPFFRINAPSDIAGPKVARNNSFNPGNVEIPLFPNGLTADLVLFLDGNGDSTDACEPAVNAAEVNGKIAVIRRGTCTFVAKVLAAQQAGAIAAIIVNNVSGSIGMAGADAAVSIPAISVSQDVGEAIITRMQTQTVNGTLQKESDFINTDGDFDNGIIAHEFGHGISTRLSGNCLSASEQQGEGWSDWFWLMMQIKPGDTRNDARGIGTFASNEPVNGNGIRQYRYSTDMAVNPHTFGNTNTMFSGTTVAVHAVGSVWAVMLWDLAWNYIDKYGYNPNIYTGNGGNNKVMRLVLDAIKLDGCAPSFVTARDALLAADLATTGGVDQCMIWSTFARRGLGFSASSGTNVGVAGIQDQIESFDTPPRGNTPATGSNCTQLGVTFYENNDLISIFPNPTNGDISIKIIGFTGKVNIKVVDINGRIVNEFVNDEFDIEKSYNLSDLQSGVYIIKITGDSINYNKKIIKN